MKLTVKEYYKKELLHLKTPMAPKYKKSNKKNRVNNILLAALSIAAVVIISVPQSYNSKVRNLEMSKKGLEDITYIFNRVVMETSLNLKNKRGDYNE